MDFDTDNIDFPALTDIHELENRQQQLDFKDLYQMLGHGTPITATKFYGEFEDDHLPCYNLSVTVNNREFKFGLYCFVNAEFIWHFGAAPYSKVSHEKVRELIISYLEDSVNFVEEE